MLSNILSKFRVETLVYQFAGPEDTSWLEKDSREEIWISANENSIRWLFRADSSRRDKFLRFLRAGYSGLFLVRNGEWISHGWITQPGNRGYPPHLPRQVSDVGAYWIFYCHTRKPFRNQGIQKRLIAQFVNLIRTPQPDAVVLCDALPDNVASNRAAKQTGFIPFGVVVTYKLWVPLVGTVALGGQWVRDQPHYAKHGLELKSVAHLTAQDPAGSVEQEVA